MELKTYKVHEWMALSGGAEKRVQRLHTKRVQSGSSTNGETL